MENQENINLDRRILLAAGAAAAASQLTGCCGLRDFQKSVIQGLVPPNMRPFLKPSSPLNAKVFPRRCIDVHAHFFNASDVPVKGYLEGPVAHDMPAPLRALVQLLAPMADTLSEAAPSAKDEFEELMTMAKQPQLLGATAPSIPMKEIFDRVQREQIQSMYDILKNSQFAEEFNRQKRQDISHGLTTSSTPARSDFSEESIRNAVEMRYPNSHETRAKKMLEGITNPSDPKEGIVAFVYYMLSRRWMNLQTYAQAFSTDKNALCVDTVLGALVDFDRWLDCPPRSSHDDQIKLHQLISLLSGGYMRPLVAYNPWTDIVTPRRGLERVIDAIDQRGFIGAKIYPPMGFRPFGNTKNPLKLSRPHRPSPEDLDRVLGDFWDTCTERDIPVMAHTGESMGWDDTYDELGGPPGWESLLDRYKGKGKGPIINAAHFGGDSAEKNTNWPKSLAKLMGRPEGKRFYGDLGYWSELRCREAVQTKCKAATERLKDALNTPLSDSETIADRIMFGTDWLMLSKERDWPDYAIEIAETLSGSMENKLKAFLGENALRCFTRL